MSTGLLSVVLPGCRAAENLRLLLPRLRRVLEADGRPFEILVVDTAAPVDATDLVCREVGVGHVRR